LGARPDDSALWYTIHVDHVKHVNTFGGGREMVTVSSEEVRDGLGDLINKVAYGGERVMVTRRGKKIVGIISAEEMELLDAILDAIEDEIDVPLVKERLAEMEKGGGIPLEQLKRELGL